MIPLNQVPSDKELLWYYDDECTHDLLQIQTYLGYNYTLLIERAVVNNVVWCDNYSTELFNLLLPLSTVKQGYNLAIATTNPLELQLPEIDTLGRVTFSFLIQDGDYIDPYNGERVAIIKRHHYSVLHSDKLFLPSILKHSLVISGDDDYVNDIKQLIPDDYLYDNIASLSDYYDFPEELVKFQQRIRTWNYIEWVLDKVTLELQVQDPDSNNANTFGEFFWEIFPDALPTKELTFEETTFLPDQPDQHGCLIYAQPQYAPITGQGKANNLIVGSPLLQAINQSQIATAYNDSLTAEPENWTLPLVEYRFSSRTGQLFTARLNQEKIFNHPYYSQLIVLQTQVTYDQEVLRIDGSLGDLAKVYKFADGVYNNLWQPDSPLGAFDGVSGNQILTKPPEFSYTGEPQFYPANIGLSAKTVGDFAYWQDIDADNILGHNDHPVYIGLIGRIIDGWMINREVKTELFYDHWLKTANITPFLDAQWLVKRQRWHNRYETLRTTLGLQGSFPFNVLDINSAVTNPYLEDEEGEIIDTKLILEQLEDEELEPDIVYNRIRINGNLTINSLPVLLTRVKSIFDIIIRFDDFDTQIPSDEELKPLLLRELIYMNDSLRIQEIHAILGASEFTYTQESPSGNTLFIYMSLARNVDLIMKALGMNYNADGTVLEVNLNEAPEAQNNPPVE